MKILQRLSLMKSECTFGSPTIEYLGHIIIYVEGVATDPVKLQQ